MRYLTKILRPAFKMENLFMQGVFLEPIGPIYYYLRSPFSLSKKKI